LLIDLNSLAFCLCFPQATAPTSLAGTGGSLKSMKDMDGKDVPSTLQTIGDHSAGYLLKRSAKNGDWNKRWFVLNEKTHRLSYTEKPEDRNFHGVITLDVCITNTFGISEMSGFLSFYYNYTKTYE
jgi:hypothetical protein